MSLRDTHTVRVAVQLGESVCEVDHVFECVGVGVALSEAESDEVNVILPVIDEETETDCVDNVDEMDVDIVHDGVTDHDAVKLCVGVRENVGVIDCVGVNVNDWECVDEYDREDVVVEVAPKEMLGDDVGVQLGESVTECVDVGLAVQEEGDWLRDIPQVVDRVIDLDMVENVCVIECDNVILVVEECVSDGVYVNG